MDLTEYSNEFRSENILLLMKFLNEEEPPDSEYEIRVIADLPTEIGLEIFHFGYKVAEVYCAEDKNGLTGRLQVYTSKNWSEPFFFQRKRHGIIFMFMAEEPEFSSEVQLFG